MRATRRMTLGQRSAGEARTASIRFVRTSTVGFATLVTCCRDDEIAKMRKNVETAGMGTRHTEYMNPSPGVDEFDAFITALEQSMTSATTASYRSQSKRGSPRMRVSFGRSIELMERHRLSGGLPQELWRLPR